MLLLPLLLISISSKLLCLPFLLVFLKLVLGLLPLQVFTTLALVGMLILPLNCFPWVLNGILEAKVSLERIQRFLELANQDLQAYYGLGKLPACSQRSRNGNIQEFPPDLRR